MTKLTLLNRQSLLTVRLRLLRQIARYTLDCPPIQRRSSRPGQVTLVLTGAAEIARINRVHLNHEGPTDVITFDYAGGDADGIGLDGEILICPAVAFRQADEFRTNWPMELVRYLVHGLLHLCGYDDLTPTGRRVMKRHENRLVKRLAEAFDCGGLEGGRK